MQSSVTTGLAAFCRAHPPLRSAQSTISNLLQWKESPFKRDGSYRKVCHDIERATRIAVEVLFDGELYGRVTVLQKTVEISSFSALPGPVREGLRHLPAPSEISLEAEREAKEKAVKEALCMLSYRREKSSNCCLVLGRRTQRNVLWRREGKYAA